MKKTIIIMLILTALISNAVLGAEVSTEAGIKSVFVQEEIKTRDVLKKYCDAKTEEMINVCKKDGQNFIDKNFQIFDNRMQKLANKMLIKFSVGIITAILFSQLLWLIIKTKIKNIKRTKTERQIRPPLP